MFRPGFIMFPVLSTLTIVGCMQSSLPSGLYEILTPRPRVHLPLDEAPHEATVFEWWYYTGRLETQEDPPRVFGTHTVIFHIPGFGQAMSEKWVAHYAVIEPRTGRFVYDQQRLSGPNPNPQPEMGFDISAGLIRMRGSQGSDAIQAVMSDGQFALDIQLEDQLGPVLYTGDGYVLFGLTGMAFYYSRPTMTGSGTLEIDDQVLPVSGQFWFDRQWGLNILGSFVEWGWFSVRFDDGNRLMLFDFNAGQVGFGALIAPDGERIDLTREQFTLSAEAIWTSPQTKLTYGSRWRIGVPALELQIEVEAVTPAQELDVRSTTGNIYWEGLCAVSGTRAGQIVTGHAFVEQANVGLGRK